MNFERVLTETQGLKTYRGFHMLFKIQFLSTNSPVFLLSLSHVFAGIVVERMK